MVIAFKYISGISTYRYPPCFESLCYAILLLWKTYICFYVCVSQKKSKEKFCFYEKRQKAKITFNVCFPVSHYRGSRAPQTSRVVPPLLPWKLRSTSQNQATKALKFVCEHPYFILIYFVYQLARCGLRY